MKKFINISFIYGIAALCSGIFYREFTKFIGFEGKTTLAFTHLHLFMLGTVMFLIIALFANSTNLTEQKHFPKFMITYNIALPFMVVMFYVRGIIQALEVELSGGISAAISGVAGIGHILMTIGIVFLFLSLKKSQSKA